MVHECTTDSPKQHSSGFQFRVFFFLSGCRTKVFGLSSRLLAQSDIKFQSEFLSGIFQILVSLFVLGNGK